MFLEASLTLLKINKILRILVILFFGADYQENELRTKWYNNKVSTSWDCGKIKLVPRGIFWYRKRMGQDSQENDTTAEKVL